MPQSLSKVYVHSVFCTKNRVNLIDYEIEEHLFSYLGGICKQLKCNPIVAGGYLNHVHILCILSREISQAKLVQELKQQSSKWMKSQNLKYENFYWQNGYGIFSVDYRYLNSTIRYIENQKEHHKTISFKNEYRNILTQYDIEFDEKYVWD